jgi:hypothetical protein
MAENCGFSVHMKHPLIYSAVLAPCPARGQPPFLEALFDYLAITIPRVN